MVNGFTTPDDRVVKAIKDARQRLLDLSRRNRMINYRQRKLWSLPIVDEIPAELYDLLVLRELAMQFKPSETKVSKQSRSAIDAANNLFEEMTEDEGDIWSLSVQTASVEARHTDKYLQTKMEPEHLQKRLFRISHTARTFFDEQGYSILYLAMGFLNWRESDSSDVKNISPMILIPVELSRTQAGASYRLAWTGDEILTNVSLKEKLKEQNVELPEFEMPEEKSGIDEYFDAVEKAVRSKSDWIIGSEIVLDFFSFAKFVMWKDLDETNWEEDAKPKNHIVIQEVFTGRSESSPFPELKEQQIDERLSCRDIHHVVDADPSQICVIETIKAGANIVVEGPPGTGKSQTIVNTIAELLAQGKRVLFVSEKMAALDVVKRRLDESGIGLYCLELHSHKSKKKSLIDALNHALLSSRSAHAGTKYEYDELERRKAELNGFAEVLRTPFGRANLTPYRLFAMAEQARRHFESAKRPEVKAWIANATETTQDDIRKAHRKLTQLADHIRHMHPLGNHPWTGTRPSNVVLDADVKDVGQQLDQLESHFTQLVKEIKSLIEATGARNPSTFAELQTTLESACIVMESEPNDISVLSNEEWNGQNEEAQTLIRITNSFQETRREIGDRFDLDRFTEPPSTLLEQFNIERAKSTRLFRPAYWRSKTAIQGLYRKSAPKNPEILANDTDKLIKCVEDRTRLSKADARGKALFGSHWRSHDSDISRLQTFSTWIIQFRKHLVGHVLTHSALTIVSKGVAQARIEQLIKQIGASIEVISQSTQGLQEKAPFEWPLLSARSFDECAFSRLEQKIITWKQHLNLLLDWSRYVRIRDDDTLPNIEKIIELIESGTVTESNDLVPAFDLSFSTSCLDQIIRQNKTLANFSAEVHEGRIRDFRKLDKDILTLNKCRLTDKLREGLPNLNMIRRGDDSTRLLKHELGKKQRHLPIRALLSRCGHIVQDIMPCFMMSPLSVAQFIDPKGLKFDVVLFDEASQVRTEDAIGPILRGAQLIVMGDTMQLPPTSFFDKMTETDGDEEEAEEVSEKNESILQRCKTTFPTSELRWHYRSKHESLIALSNIEFYNNNLNVFPASQSKVEHLGMKLVHLPDTIWDRGKGKSRTNRKEAEDVTNFVVSQFKKSPEKSIGVATFNKNQAGLIWEMMESQRRHHPEIESLFSEEHKEPFFVKNLESIQGDERDFIIVSVGYGKDSLGKINQNFGPVNSLGGENRLNVLFTRAREQCIIFSNMTSADIRLSEGKEERGVAVFKKFLEYAETGEIPKFAQPLGETDSEFEDSVKAFLSESGYLVDSQVGCAGYRIDLAVVHPKRPGTYAIGIECDGASYHSSRVARERDRQRQEILERLAWRLYRVWSTDWYTARDAAKNKLLREIENAILLN